MSSPRTSFLEAFPRLDVSSFSAQATGGTANKSLAFRLSRAFSNGWPAWCSARFRKPASPTINFTVKLVDCLRGEVGKIPLPVEPENIIAEAHKTSQRTGVKAFPELWEQLEDSLVTLIYGSNKIETAGSSLKVTIQLCQKVFRGVDVCIDISERDPSYQDHLQALHSTNRKPDEANVIRSRKEVIFHAKALSYMIDHIVLNDEPWSEEMICHTHAILYHGLDDGVEAGKYRNYEVAVAYGDKGKKSICLRASAVPKYMSSMIQELNKEIARAQHQTGQIDPYTLAARYHHQFVTIHPFGDGNGRMSRLISNVLLLKYAGHVAPFGGERDEMEEYLSIVRRGGTVFHLEDMEVAFCEQTCHREFAKYLLAKSKPSLEQMWTWALRDKESSSNET